MKNLTIVTSYFMPEPVVINRLSPIITEFNKKGFTLNLVFPKTQDNKKYFPGYIKFYEADLVSSKYKNYLKRASLEIFNTIKLLKIAKQIESDIYIVTIPSMFLAFFSPIILRKKKTFLDIRDLTWEYLNRDELLERICKALFKMCFKICIKYFKGVFVTNKSEKEYVTKQSKGKVTPLIITNGISLQKFEQLQKLKIAKSINIVYIGNVGVAQNLKTFVTAAMMLPEYNFQIVGNGIELKQLKHDVVKNKIKNLEFKGLLEWNELKDIYNNAMILYAQLRPEYLTAMPTKLYEYLASGKFIIYGGNSQALRFLKDFRHNIVIYPCNAAILVNAIRESVKSTEISKLCVYNQKLIRENYIRENSAKLLVSYIEDCCN